LLRDGVNEGWWFFFGHDHRVIRGRPVKEETGVGLAEVLRNLE
jgi:hypothetical protein